MKKLYFYILGLITGFLNGIFGSGGGIVAVPLLKKAEIEQRKSHATALLLTFPLSCLSAFLYSIHNTLDFKFVLILIPFGLIGAIIGARLLKRISVYWLRKIFGVVLILSAVRIFIK